MPFSSKSLLTAATCLFSLLSLVSAHTVITYPGWRGNNLHTYGNVTDPGVDGLGAGPNGTYPYGMQWIYPCMTGSQFLRKSMILTTSRRRYASLEQSHPLACDRRRRRLPTRLVPRSLLRSHLHQPRRRHDTSKHVDAYAIRICNHWTHQCGIPRQRLHASSSTTRQLHCRDRPERDDPGHRDCAAWSCFVQREYSV